MLKAIQKYLNNKISQLLLIGSLGLLFLLNLTCLGLLSQQYGTNLTYIILVVAIIAAVCGIVAWVYLFRVNTASIDFEQGEEKDIVPRGYKEIFSLPVDPIGSLYVWRFYTRNKDEYLGYGPQLVDELEDYLERHCDIRRIGSFGEMVKFDPNKYVYLTEAGNVGIENVTPGKGTRVKIIEPGWRWGKDQILRRPRVR